MKSKKTGKIIADTCIRVSTETKTELTRIGAKNQTYDQVLREILLEYNTFH